MTSSGARATIGKATLRSSGEEKGARVTSTLPIEVKVCTYTDCGRIERRLEICGPNGSTIATIDVCPRGEIVIDAGPVYGDGGSVTTLHRGTGDTQRSAVIQMVGHDAVRKTVKKGGR